jgi:hypothetical protein
LSEDVRHLTTEEERARLYAARSRGGICSICGRALRAGEPVYWERFTVGKIGGYTTYPQAPVGAECVSQWILEEKEHEAPAPCAGCARPVYYSLASAARRRAVCSARCYVRANRAGRAARARKGPAA